MSFQEFRDNILSSSVLAPQPCSVFNKDLLYLFYGRPSYKVSKTVTVTGQLRHVPVCLILEPDSVKSDIVFPFDTGAYANGLFDGFLSGLELKNFQLGEFPHSSQKLVSAFYQTNKKYYYGEVVDSISVSAADFEISAYFDLIKDTVTYYAGGSVPSDDRRQTIEIQADSAVDLLATDTLINDSVVVRNNVLAVIVPEKALDSPKILDAITISWKAVPITYGTYAFTKPEGYHSVIREKVADFLKRRGLI